MTDTYENCVKRFYHVLGQVIDNSAPRIVQLRIAFFDDHILINYWLFNVCFVSNEEFINRFVSENENFTWTPQNSIHMVVDKKAIPDYENWFTLGLLKG